MSVLNSLQRCSLCGLKKLDEAGSKGIADSPSRKKVEFYNKYPHQETDRKIEKLSHYAEKPNFTSKETPIE